MRKIPTLFVRDPEDRAHVTRDVNPECEWVIAGEGRPTRKYDGTCVMFDGDQWWARREVKPGKDAPPGFVAIETDPNTGKTVGWEPAERSGFWKFLVEAAEGEAWQAGTFELVGPKINGNPEHADGHMLIRHGINRAADDRDYDGLRDALLASDAEGIVWHHPDGRMCKLKKRDFPTERSA